MLVCSLFPSHSPGQEVIDTQFPPDVLRILVGGGFVLSGARTRSHLETLQSGELASDFIRDPIREVIIVAGSHIFERQHGEAARAGGSAERPPPNRGGSREHQTQAGGDCKRQPRPPLANHGDRRCRAVHRGCGRNRCPRVTFGTRECIAELRRGRVTVCRNARHRLHADRLQRRRDRRAGDSE
jgi:hypothetical protein